MKGQGPCSKNQEFRDGASGLLNQAEGSSELWPLCDFPGRKPVKLALVAGFSKVLDAPHGLQEVVEMDYYSVHPSTRVTQRPLTFSDE